ncbi:type I restriction enzyme, S subunit [Nitrosomonas cryotolerans]|uniref:Type I restriction enzyme, S subunit n=1 Tax=Nitrosomonas cryotolerans ATCC 49181 TaxID=1131553 RepID=A0A1N6IZF7_9PROT|nr:restriction endonuclease subunit S [Nitrosomonas cryotolerans]SFP54924.1 type I restriction enzyme, S subunit [Nitrosomonas cryotolerans]SIO37256.1 type I restriction enzyme, S subunit [Nitrosomonas cryotolerans ATCC 49181]
MRDGWSTAKLGGVCQMIKRGIAPKYTENGGVCVINQKCVRDHKVNYELARRHDIGRKGINEERYIQVGDVLVNSTGTGTLGRVAQIRKKPTELTTVDTHVTICRPVPEKFFEAFFGYMLIKIEDEITSSGEGASGQTELARTTLENKFEVSFPHSLSEQKRIVAILDEAFAGIDKAIVNTQQNLANARELFESYLNSIFTQKGDGWHYGELADIGGDIRTGPFGSLLHKSDYIDNGTPLINPAHINAGLIIPDMRKTVDSEALDRLSNYRVKIGDVIIGRRGEMGRCAAITEVEEGWLCGTGCFIISSKNNNEAEFIALLLSSNFYKEEITKLASGATMLNLSNEALGSLTVSLPSPKDQILILQQIKEVTNDQIKLNQLYKQKLTALTELKQSLLTKAFSGELTADELPIKKEATV